MTTLLAFDTATERMSIALSHAGRVWAREGDGGAAASAALIPSIFSVLSDAGIALAQVDGIAFGRGPGAFTGLRTACSVAQGLALGAGKPVLPIDTLLAVAEDARGDAQSFDVWVAMDARMNEIYAAHYQWQSGRWITLAAPMLTDAGRLNLLWQAHPPALVAGSALGVAGETLATGSALLAPEAAPRATAMLALAQAQWHEHGGVDAALAMPLYVRDKVAQTTEEREALRAAKEAAAVEAAR